MKHHNLYPTSTGQTIVSPINLEYALNSYRQVDISKIRANDFKKINLISDSVMAHTMLELLEEKTWRTAEEAIATPEDMEAYWEGDYCVIQGSTVYIRNGRRYETLDSIVEKSDKNMLSVILHFVARQSALCQATIAKLLCEKKLTT